MRLKSIMLILKHLNDNRWPQMWYLNRGGHLDMNVQGAWMQGGTGKGMSVTILDDGIEKSHPDLVANYDPLASFDVNQNDNDPTPRYDLIDSNRHGTRCAGEVAATANNSNCAVGIAYKAGIGGVRMLDGDVTDAVEARSLGLNNQHIHIYSASWGPDDDGKTVDGPGRLATRAFLQGISQGRNGKGSIFVWAAGNGGRDYDNCNCDGYTNSIWTWRDVQHVTVRCAHNANLRANDWSQNAVGRNFSHSFGYGLMDAACMVRLAKQWKSVPDQLKCSRGSEKSGSIFVQGGSSQKSTIHVSNCDDDLSFIEHVQAHVTLGAAKRGDVRIYLTSPKGTKSLLIAKRPKDYSRAGFNDWPFLTVHMWEESPIGDWTLEVINDGRSIVELKKWSLAFFGTKDHPQPNLREVPRQQPNEPSEQNIELNQVPDLPIQKTADVTNMHSKPLKQSESVEKVFLEHCLDARDPKWCSICESGFLMLNGRCLESCPAEGYYQGTENHQDSCLQCYYSCK